MEYSRIAQDSLLDVMMHLKDNVGTHIELLTEESGKDAALDWEAIISLAVHGNLELFVGVDGDVKAYAAFMTGKNILYRHINEATNIVLFVDPEYRDKTADMLGYCEEQLKLLGFDEVNYMLRSEKLGKYLKMKGYKNDYKLWSKEL